MTSASRTYGGVTAEERRATRRAALTDAALDLLSEGGVHAVSKRAVCARARLNDRYFYESFTDTDALLQAIVAEQLELLLARVAPAVAEQVGLREQCRAIAGSALEFLAEDPRRVALLLGSRGSEVFQRARIDSARTIATAIATMSDDGAAPPESTQLDREVAAYALVSGAMEVIEAWFRGDIATTSDHLADLVAGLLAATPAIIGSR